ncbi:MAG TPA: phage portal protein [Acidimicrobiales bacterium]|nr:phage portal protein [Acidimicrobiales bacterium]
MTVLGALLSRASLEAQGGTFTGGELMAAGLGDDTDVSPETAARFSAVYRSWAIIASTIGALPLHAYTGQRGQRKQYGSSVTDNPHPEATPMEVIEYLVLNLLAYGNSVSWKARDGLGRVQELWPLRTDPRKIDIRREKPSDANPSGKVIEIDDPPEGKDRIVFAGVNGQVMHVPALALDGVKGMSPIRHVARQGIRVALAAERLGHRMFESGMLTTGYLKTDQELEEPDARRLQARWAERTSGPDNNWRIPVLDAGGTFEEIGIPPDDAQFLETRRFQVSDVARTYGVPPHMVGETDRSTSWGTGIEQQTLGFIMFTLLQWTERIEQRWTKELLPPGRYAKFTVAGLLRGDTKSRYEAYGRAMNGGWGIPDEIRDLEDLPPLPGDAGRLPWRPKNVEAVGDEVEDVEEDEDAAT